MKQWIKHLINALTITSIACSAHATISMPDGWYVGAQIGKTHVLENDFSNSDKTARFSGNLFLGYKIIPFTGLETGLIAFDETISTQNGRTTFKNDHHSWYLALKAMVPIENSGFEPYAKIGMQRLTSRAKPSTYGRTLGYRTFKDTSSGLYLAVGCDYYFWPYLAAGIEWQRAKGDRRTGSYDMYGIGLTYIVG